MTRKILSSIACALMVLVSGPALAASTAIFDFSASSGGLNAVGFPNDGPQSCTTCTATATGGTSPAITVDVTGIRLPPAGSIWEQSGLNIQDNMSSAGGLGVQLGSPGSSSFDTFFNTYREGVLFEFGQSVTLDAIDFTQLTGGASFEIWVGDFDLTTLLATTEATTPFDVAIVADTDFTVSGPSLTGSSVFLALEAKGSPQARLKSLSVSAAVVPIPAALPLFATAGIVLLAVGRRRRAA
ncbi:MAG: hypothetical protein K0U93_25980 [Gammaproteobacteria bacterium]|nr:hypothetical protein [Gammaproteobacteria bacterium]